MKILALTGSIGAGKSTTAGLLRQRRIPVHDADATVRRLLRPAGAAAAAVAAAFPEMVDPAGGINRQLLAGRVFRDAAARQQLEAILHPLVRRAEQEFLRRCRLRRCRMAVLDIPLLFETGGEGRADLVLCVTAPAWLRHARIRRRGGIPAERVAAIEAAQWPDRQKCLAADWVLPTGLGLGPTRRRLTGLLRSLCRPAPSAPVWARRQLIRNRRQRGE